MKEYILCASIHFDDGQKHEHQPKNIETGFVVCGRRHHNCYTSLQDIAKTMNVSDENAINAKILTGGRDGQGFMTNLDRHVNRAEAFKIAEIAGQLRSPQLYFGNPHPILISEELY